MILWSMRLFCIILLTFSLCSSSLLFTTHLIHMFLIYKSLSTLLPSFLGSKQIWRQKISVGSLPCIRYWKINAIWAVLFILMQPSD